MSNQFLKYTLISSCIKHGRKVVGYFRERGFIEGAKRYVKLKEIQAGELKGVDRNGLEYWEDSTMLTGRNRYVVYPKRKDADASLVPPEWHAWLHYINDKDPIAFPPPVPIYKLEHERAAMSQQGIDANHLPAGHMLCDKHHLFGRTGADAADTNEGTYQAWKADKGNTSPESVYKYYTKTERRV